MKRYSLTLLLLTICMINSEAVEFPRLIAINGNYSSTKDSDLSNDKTTILAKEISFDTLIFSRVDTVEIQLDKEDIIVVKTHRIAKEDISYQYCAYESAYAHVFLSKLGSDIQGIIHSASGSYTIRTHDNIYILEKKNVDEFPDESEPLLQESRNEMGLSQSSETHSSIIRVLVMYTPQAFSSTSAMLNKVYLDINNGNISLINSNINAQLELAYVGQTFDSETGLSFNQLLEKFKTNGDNYFDEVHSLRNKYSADLCVLLVSSIEYCGLGYIGPNSNYAFAVVSAYSGCATKYSFAHEIGHNLGCGHDLGASSHQSSCSYGHGYVHYVNGDIGSSWRTMMAYGDACGGELYCGRILYWSNPNVDYNGNPTGNTTQCNNARVWNENTSTVSAFKTTPTNLTITCLDINTNMRYAHWKAVQTIIVNNGYEVASGQVVNMTAANSITIGANTHIKAGANFHAQISTNTSGNYYSLPAIRNDHTSSNESINHYNSDCNATSKILRDGRIYILRGENVYTLQGQEVK